MREVMRERTRRKANELNGKTWTRYSISVWADIRKSATEYSFKHPAMFPVALVTRLIECFMRAEDRVVLDPFMGSGATLVGASMMRKYGIGFDVCNKYVRLAQNRLANLDWLSERDWEIHKEDARRLRQFCQPCSVDFCVTSPPYWDILSQKRSADYKAIKDYADAEGNLGKLKSYEEFLRELLEVFRAVLDVLRPGGYCVVNVMDIRKKSRFYPYHSDLADRMGRIGFVYDDLIIWDRRHEYNNLRPLGYPTVFRVNKVHEFLLIFKKPDRGRP
ncbi:MAG: DNA methyltransferase [Thermoplasmata archaeon]